MADVTLYFSPFPGANAIGLQVEESPTGSDPWTQILDTDQIGTFPNWVSSYVVQADSISNWFRLRWQLVGTNVFTEWSDPVLGSALPYHWTVPDLYRVVSHHNLAGWSNQQLQIVIDRAYWMLQGECGPYDETADGFADIAQMAIHVVMDRLLPTMGMSGSGIGGGMEEEQFGSYRYRRSAEAVDMYLSALALPSDIMALLCPFGSGDGGSFLVTSTQVFLETPYVLDRTDKQKVFTTQDRNRLAPLIDSPWPWWRF